jgi:hypothetical protein
MAPAESQSSNSASPAPQPLPRARESPAALWFAIRAGALLWLGDLVWLLRERPAYPGPTAQGLLAALFLCLFVFAAVGLLLELVARLARLGGSRELPTRARRWLLADAPPERSAHAASLLAWPLVLLGYVAA